MHTELPHVLREVIDMNFLYDITSITIIHKRYGVIKWRASLIINYRSG